MSSRLACVLPGGNRAAFLDIDDMRRKTTVLIPCGDIRGGIKGSQPVWGRYAPMSFPNWATKFFVDAMWLRPGLEA